MLYFPINIDLYNRNILVIGGGKVAARKVNALFPYVNFLTVLAPKIEQEIEGLNKINFIRRAYQNGDLQDFNPVFVATNNKALNQEIFLEAQKLNILVNTVDTPKLCNFILPASLRRGDLTISISTNGQCPALAKNLRIEFEKKMTTAYATVTKLLGKIRKEGIDLNINDLPKKLDLFMISLNEILSSIEKQSYAPIEERIEKVFGFKLKVSDTLKEEEKEEEEFK